MPLPHHMVQMTVLLQKINGLSIVTCSLAAHVLVRGKHVAYASS